MSGAQVHGRGTTAAEAFAEAARGLFALAVSPGAIEARDVREVRAHGASPDALLQAWLGECLYVLDVEAFAASRVEWIRFSLEPAAGGEPLRLHARLHGEEIAADGRPVGGLAVMTARLIESAGGFEAAADVRIGPF